MDDFLKKMRDSLAGETAKWLFSGVAAGWVLVRTMLADHPWIHDIADILMALSFVCAAVWLHWRRKKLIPVLLLCEEAKAQIEQVRKESDLLQEERTRNERNYWTASRAAEWRYTIRQREDGWWLRIGLTNRGPFPLRFSEFNFRWRLYGPMEPSAHMNAAVLRKPDVDPGAEVLFAEEKVPDVVLDGCRAGRTVRLEDVSAATADNQPVHIRTVTLDWLNVPMPLQEEKPHGTTKPTP